MPKIPTKSLFFRNSGEDQALPGYQKHPQCYSPSQALKPIFHLRAKNIPREGKSRKELSFLRLLCRLIATRYSLDGRAWLAVEEKEKGLKKYKDIRESARVYLPLFSDIFHKLFLFFIFSHGARCNSWKDEELKFKKKRFQEN